MRAKASAPGKIIISGEHGVIYGYPALAAAINKRLSIDSLGKVQSNIPVGSGLGSSAAYSVARAALKIGSMDLQKINALAYKYEKRHHTNPSGVDNTISTYGGFLWYRKEAVSLKLFEAVRLKSFNNLFVVNTGRPVESTSGMIQMVADAYKRTKNRIEGIFREIEKITRIFLSPQASYPELIKANERLLEKLGVVSAKTEAIVRSIERLGGAAKVTGAGGRKEHSGVLLVFHSDRKKFMDFVKKKKLDAFSVKLGGKGVNYERVNTD